MENALELLLGTLGMVLAALSFAVGGPVMREAWRQVSKGFPVPTAARAAWKPTEPEVRRLRKDRVRDGDGNSGG